jgi:hypothetical protein
MGKAYSKPDKDDKYIYKCGRKTGNKPISEIYRRSVNNIKIDLK